MSTIILKSPAKVNLCLRVLKKRTDGFHEIYSVMALLSLHDEVSLVVLDGGGGGGIALSSDSAEVPLDNANLCYRATEIILKRYGFSKKIEIGIKKSIPVGAGLGGGSSNAAAVLMGLNNLLGVKFSERDLMEMGAEIGSDVPFFMLNTSAEARGRGELLKKVSLPSLHYVLINPGYGVSTAWAYNNLDLTNCRGDNILTYSDSVLRDAGKLRLFSINDLEAVTLRKHSDLKGLKDALMGQGAETALMSGSGPTVFGLFKEGSAAQGAYEALKKEFEPKGCRVFLTEGL